MDGIKRYIRIEVQNKEEQFDIGNKIHKQLVGNKDYIDCNIILNIDFEPHVVHLWIYDECENVPEINI